MMTVPDGRSLAIGVMFLLGVAPALAQTPAPAPAAPANGQGMKDFFGNPISAGPKGNLMGQFRDAFGEDNSSGADAPLRELDWSSVTPYEEEPQELDSGAQ